MRNKLQIRKVLHRKSSPLYSTFLVDFGEFAVKSTRQSRGVLPVYLGQFCDKPRRDVEKARSSERERKGKIPGMDCVTKHRLAA